MAETLRIAGVPEHFNLPWHLALDEGAFSRRGIDLEWLDVPEGSGKMCEMLRTGQTELALVLTEAFVKAASDGLDARIAQTYVASPLLWGVHVAAGSPFGGLPDLAGRKAAISRTGSGSHLMAYVLGQREGWPVSGMDFEIINTLDGAVKALQSGTADYFL